LATTIHESSEALVTIVNDILDYSRLEVGRVSIEQTAFNLIELLRSVERVFCFLAAEHGLTFALVLDENVPASIVGDGGRLRQVLNNLLGNAVKFTQEGSVTLSVECVPLHGGDSIADANLSPSSSVASSTRRRIRFCVTDTGVGIAKEHQKRIFEKFTQVDASVTRKFGGTGLGLAIASQLVSLQGGLLELESELGEGTSVSFDLLVCSICETRSVEARPDPELCRVLSVLVVDDNRTNRKVAERFLSKAGCDPTTVEGGAQALEILERRRFDLILMDCQMPQMDGLETTRRIRKLPGGDTLLIYALTANVSRQDVAACLASGMNGHLAKPLNLSALERVLSEAEKRNPLGEHQGTIQAG
jgi:CheY-like chemotaxis protein